jgi:hypothetical protein
MSKREKIIVSIMLLALLVGGYFYFYSSEGPAIFGQLENQAEALDQFVIATVNDLAATDRTVLDNFIIDKAREKWTNNIFQKKTKKTVETTDEALIAENEATAEPVFAPLPLRYSGYLKIGIERLAIINGEGYAIGERIEPEGAVLVDILPTKAIVHFGAENAKITLPLRESE